MSRKKTIIKCLRVTQVRANIGTYYLLFTNSRINPSARRDFFIPMAANQPQYTGTWIPAHVMEDANLSSTGKILYAMIASFKHCYASNAYFAEKSSLTERSIQRGLLELETKEYIIRSGNNENRIITALRDAPTSVLPRHKRRSGHDINVTPATTQTSPNNKVERKAIKKRAIFAELASDCLPANDDMPVVFGSTVEAMQNFIDDRKERKKPMTARAVTLAFKRVYEWYPNSMADQVACINQSIEHGWLGLFELKSGGSAAAGTGVAKI